MNTYYNLISSILSIINKRDIYDKIWKEMYNMPEYKHYTIGKDVIGIPNVSELISLRTYEEQYNEYLTMILSHNHDEDEDTKPQCCPTCNDPYKPLPYLRNITMKNKSRISAMLDVSNINDIKVIPIKKCSPHLSIKDETSWAIPWKVLNDNNELWYKNNMILICMEDDKLYLPVPSL